MGIPVAFRLDALSGFIILFTAIFGVLVVLFCGVYFVGLALVEARRWSTGALLKLGAAALLAALILSPLAILVWQSLQQPGGEELLRAGADATPSMCP